MILYEFNKNTLQFNKTSKRKIHLKHTIKTVFITAFLLNIFYLTITTPKEHYLQVQNNNMIEKYDSINLLIDYGIEYLYKLNRKNDIIYNNVIHNTDVYGIGGVDVDIDSTNLYNYTTSKLTAFLADISMYNKRGDSLICNINEVSNTPSISPILSSNIVSFFGLRFHPIHKTIKMHTGIDYGVNVGTNIYSTAHGIVERVDYKQTGYGYQIIIKHKKNYKTRYAHLSKILIAKGDTVFRGQLIALSGNTGLSTGPHLHYEIIHNNKAINPIKFSNVTQTYKLLQVLSK